mgnify:FL=1
MSNFRRIDKKKFGIFSVVLLLAVVALIRVEWAIISALFANPLPIFIAVAVISSVVVGVVAGRWARPSLWVK